MEIIKTKPSNYKYRKGYDGMSWNHTKSRDLPATYHTADPEPIKLDEDGKVTVLIKTLDGDIRI